MIALKRIPIALTIAGSDSGGGAGIQADLKAFSANKAYGASAITAITAQNTTSVMAVHEVPTDIVAAQISAVLSDISVDAIKLGMLFSAPIISAVSNALKTYDGKIVVDPVMIAKSGDMLLQDKAISALLAEILPRADLLTPNLPEAARLLNCDVANSNDEIIAQARALLQLGPKAVLLKGGHADGGICTDVLVDKSGVVTSFTAPRINTKNTHGTGCTYSAAIAAHLAHGEEMVAAVQRAHDYLHASICAADTLDVGAGHGPVHHFSAMWT
ncbi:bifunctional hydroxymethylpyrimidine kinase/phosphomethylpyrimidine kinase [Ahrensia sp. 13_GOM-1096m]|uniref:bifunctional hydroxymethylpyrimidine kinase/phosphomethylpyrimidine kinase n=1 Tax=Ahrensia sp. 13_GOM-1096m TaxID=1380380 RepID=UPI00047CAFF5|nr:bifunctional hydroxymethylpyrimidine kinase/phosphomethylpyrimidine kinase [Ahrensia sp. 13_GOM-1096m]